MYDQEISRDAPKRQDSGGLPSRLGGAGSRRIIMTVDEILQQLEPLGRDSYKNVLLNHGVQEPVFGVKIE